MCLPRLSPLRFTTLEAQFDLSSVAKSGGDFQVSSLARVIDRPAITELVVRAWIERAYKQRRSTLVFAVNIEHIGSLCAEFLGRGVDARGIHSKMPIHERAALLAAFRDGAFPVLVNCDVPPIDCILLARPTQSQNLFSQMIGRGMRLSPETNKTDCLILDLVGNLEKDLVCTPTLFGLYDEQPIEGTPRDSPDESVENLLQRARKPEEAGTVAWEAPLPTSFAFVDYESSDELHAAMQAKPSAHITSLSPNAWVDCGEDTYVLPSYDQSYLKIQRADAGSAHKYVGYYYPQNPAYDWVVPGLRSGTPYWQRKEVLQSSDLPHAVRGCDTFLAKLFTAAGRNPLWLRRTAQWRQKPASLRAKEAVLRRLHGKASDAPPDASTETMSQGTVSTMLARLRHGGKARWKRAMQKHNKQWEKAQRTPTVRTGPLPKPRPKT